MLKNVADKADMAFVKGIMTKKNKNKNRQKML